MEGNRSRRGKRAECILRHSQGHSKASWHTVCPCPALVVCISRRHVFRGLVTRFPVFSGFVAGTAFFFISSSCLAALLLPMVYWTGHLGPEDRSPVRSDFSPKRESKSPGQSKPRSRVRYDDEEKQTRRQRQYTAGGVGSSRSRSSKSSRRSLVGPPHTSFGM